MKLLEARRVKLHAYIWHTMAMRAGRPLIMPLASIGRIRAKSGRLPRATVRIVNDLGGQAIKDGHRIIAYWFDTPPPYMGDRHAEPADPI